MMEPDACAVTDGYGEVETVVYGEMQMQMQMKQDRIILIFRSQVIEMTVSKYCGTGPPPGSQGTSASESLGL